MVSDREVARLWLGNLTYPVYLTLITTSAHHAAPLSGSRNAALSRRFFAQVHEVASLAPSLVLGLGIVTWLFLLSSTSNRICQSPLAFLSRVTCLS